MKKTIVIDGWEYDTETTQNGVAFKDLKIPEGKELWTAEDCVKLHNSEKYRKLLNLEDCWFFIKQPFELNKNNRCMARFYADSDWANLNCYWDPRGSDPALGVRFKRKVKK